MNRESTRVRILAAMVIVLALLTLAGAISMVAYSLSGVQSGYEFTAGGGPGVTVIVVQGTLHPDPTKAFQTFFAIGVGTVDAKFTMRALTRTATPTLYPVPTLSVTATVSK